MASRKTTEPSVLVTRPISPKETGKLWFSLVPTLMISHGLVGSQPEGQLIGVCRKPTSRASPLTRSGSIVCAERPGRGTSKPPSGSCGAIPPSGRTLAVRLSESCTSVPPSGSGANGGMAGATP